MSLSHYKKLVLATASALYAGPVPNSAGGSEKHDTTGVMVVVLSSLTRRVWVKEIELAADLKLGQKLVRRALKQLENDQLIVREVRKDTKKGLSKEVADAAAASAAAAKAKMLESAGVTAEEAGKAAATGAAGAECHEERDTARENEKSSKNGVFQWISLDYGHFADVVRLKLHRLRSKISAQLDQKLPDPDLVCQGCGNRKTQLDAFADGLMNPETMIFECDLCGGPLLPEGTKGDAQDAHRERAEALRAALASIDKHLAPVIACLARVRTLQAPIFRSLDEWRRMEAAKRGVAQTGGAGFARPLEEGGSGLGDINIEVDLGDGPGDDGRLGGPKRPKRALPAFFNQDHSIKRARVNGAGGEGGKAQVAGAPGAAAAGEPPASVTAAATAAAAVSKAEADALDSFYQSAQAGKEQTLGGEGAADAAAGGAGGTTDEAAQDGAAAAAAAADDSDSDSDGWEEA